MSNLRLLVVASFVLLLSFPNPARSDSYTIDFEGVPDGTSAATLYAPLGVTFSSGIVLVSGAFGGSLNEVDFPPVAPGQAVFVNEADLTTLDFSSSILSFSANFTYGGPITLNFYGPLNTLLTTLTSAFQTNIASGGDPGSSSNEALSVSGLVDVQRVEILVPGADFTMDNLIFTTASTPSTPAPEPSSLILISIAGVGHFLARLVLRRAGSSA
jgi:hypothetical protein